LPRNRAAMVNRHTTHLAFLPAAFAALSFPPGALASRARRVLAREQSRAAEEAAAAASEQRERSVD